MDEKILNLIEEIVELLEQRNYVALKSLINTLMPADLALLFEEFDKKEVVIVFRLLSKELAAETFAYLDTQSRLHLLDAISDREIREVFDLLFIDDTVDIIEEMPANVVTRILSNTDAETRKCINDILKYPEDSAGSLMTIEYVSLKKHMTVADAIAKIRREGSAKETVYTCYVTDDDRVLLGLIDVSVLLTSDDSLIIGDIMETNVISVNTHEDREVVARAFNKYAFIALPVVDKEQRLVGIVTVDDAIDVITEENTEDMSHMAAMQPIEGTYFKTSVFNHAKNRILWLLILMISSTVTGMILQDYERAISVLPVLVSSIPMLMNTGGNSGSQSATMIICGLASGEIRFSDILKVIFKEFRISIFVSIFLAVANFLRIMIMGNLNLLGDLGGVAPLTIALIVSLSLILVVIIAKFIGCTLPLLAHKVGLDPALMAAPIITTIVDACAVLIYFKIAVTWLNIL